MFDFSGKTVLVTGGTSGIGRAIAGSVSRSRGNVVAAGLPEDQPPGDIMTVYLDVTDDRSIATVVDRLPAIDVLVNAAGIIKRDQEFELNVFTAVLEVNLTGTMRVSMAAYPKLKEKSGAIVNVASMLSFFGGARVPAYSASKGGVAQLTKSLAVAWAAHGIRVNAVAPGWIETPLTQGLREDAERSAALTSRTPMGRWGLAREVAAPVLFLCSEAASFITGAILTVDGGYSAA